MISNNNPCRFLQWDSEFFGFRIASAVEDILTIESLDEITSWCSDNKIDCLYFLADAGDAQTVELAEEQKFRLTDIRITLERKLHGEQKYQDEKSDTAQIAVAEDIEKLREIASVNHRDSRFYYDGKFPLQKCDELYATWIEKSCEGFADAVLVVKNDKIIEGYITCLIDECGNGSIGLVGVNPARQGQGTGRILVGSAVEWFRNNNVFEISVVTQGRNIKAQRLYQRNGFATKSVKIWYHRWFV